MYYFVLVSDSVDVLRSKNNISRSSVSNLAHRLRSIQLPFQIFKCGLELALDIHLHAKSDVFHAGNREVQAND